jgi:hypothetical protein
MVVSSANGNTSRNGEKAEHSRAHDYKLQKHGEKETTMKAM